MRTNIDIDDKLINDILKVTGIRTNQASLRSHERFWDIQVHQNRFDL
ncbi:MAG: type II toxin-antitoxin system VapB family antitoxin [Candidatus Thiodiazotropha sp.]